MKGKSANSVTYGRHDHSRIVPKNPLKTRQSRNRSGSHPRAALRYLTACASCTAPKNTALSITSRQPRRECPLGQPQASAKSRTSLVRRICKRLTSLAQHLGRDELAVLILVAERLRSGRRIYGELRLATDRRDFTHEALEEAADMAVYAAAGLLRTERKIDLLKTKQRWR